MASSERILQLPPFSLPASPSIVTDPVGRRMDIWTGWDTYSWADRIVQAKKNLPICWGSDNVWGATDLFPSASSSYIYREPVTPWDAEGLLLRRPKAVLFAGCPITLFPTTSQIVSDVGADNLDEAGILLACCGFGNTYNHFINRPLANLRAGLPCHKMDLIQVQNVGPFLSTMTYGSGFADKTAFVGGEVLIFTAGVGDVLTDSAWYIIEHSGLGNPDAIDTVGMAHDQAEVNRTAEVFDKIAWAHFIDSARYGTFSTTDPLVRSQAAAAVAGVSSYATLTTLDLSNIAVVRTAIAEKIQSFFNL